MVTFKEAKWNMALMAEWMDIWSKVWHAGDIKWEWQTDDYYTSTFFPGIHRVTAPGYMASKESWHPIPLPSWSVMQDIAEYVFPNNRELYNELHDFSQKLVPENDERV